MSQHARLSPSSAHRWIECRASVREAEKLPDLTEEPSEYALEGTNAHWLAELRARVEFGLCTEAEYRAGLKEWETAVPDEETRAEMEHHTDGYIDLLRERLQQPGAALFVEQRMDSGVPESWGTSDAVVVTPSTVEIVDLKYGAGVPVQAAGNPQLRLYALGALETYGNLLGETTSVSMTVYQPRVGNVSTETLEAAALRLWRDEVATPAAEEALYSPTPRFGPSESACRWCPLAGVCRARMEWATAADFGDLTETPAEPTTLTPEELGQVLPRLKSITSWAKDVEAAALTMAYSEGTAIPGYKVVRSGGARKIVDDAAAIQRLIDMGFSAEQVARPVQAATFSTLEKLLGKDGVAEHLGDLITRTEGREALVPEHDKRPAISPAVDAAADFSSIG